MAHAATDGRKIAFHWLIAGRTLEGYLVGMDDFHWLVVPTTTLPNQTAKFVPTMVHKGSPDLIILDKESSLGSEPAGIRKAVEDIGRGFFAYCEKVFLGKN